MWSKPDINQYLLGSILDSITSLEGANQKSALLGRIEEIFGEPQGAISSAVSGLLDAFNDLSITPEGANEREAVVLAAYKLSENMREVSNSASRFRDDLRASMKDALAEINVLIDQVNKINQKVAQSKEANDLSDHLESALRDLSKYLKLNVQYNSDKTVSITSGGVFLADRNTANVLSLSYDSQGKAQITVAGKSTVLNTDSGILASMLSVHNNDLDTFQKNLDELASNIVKEINVLHQGGKDQYGSDGGNFFNPSGTKATTIYISDDIIRNNKLIAASSDGSTAAEIAGFLENSAFKDTLEKTVMLVAIAKKAADSDIGRHELLNEALDTRYKTETGVDLTEEMMELSKAQKAYAACAQVFKVMQEMLDVVLKLGSR
jgi:flagellar hook-associated protein 1 FlgK